MTRIYVHPTCTGCKKVETFLASNEIKFDRRDYFGQRFSESELGELFQSIGATPSEILSKRSRAYQARKEEIDAMSDSELITEMVAEPTLIRRPIVVGASTFIVGSRKADLEAFASAVKDEG